MSVPLPGDASSVTKGGSAPLLLGVDGGGTKTLAWLAVPRGKNDSQVIGRGVAGSSNSVAAGDELAFANLKQAIDQALADAQSATPKITCAVMALAGSGTDSAQQRIREFVERCFALESLQIIHDGQAVLHAGTPDGIGIALIAGTGAVAYGEDSTGNHAVVGGWGYWFGDEGSAYWIGQSALRAISRASDGRATATKLTERVLSHLQIEQPRELLAALTNQGDTRSAIAGLAALVCEVAERGDSAAAAIVEQAVDHWAQHITTLADQLSLPKQFSVALAGGVLCGCDFARNLLIQRVAGVGMDTTRVKLVDQPVAGCVQLAARCLPDQSKSSESAS